MNRFKLASSISIGLLAVACGSEEPKLLAPNQLSATATSPTSVHLTWVDRSTTEIAFVVQRALGAEGSFLDVVALAADVTSADDGNLTPATLYRYRVQAKDEAGTRVSSDPVSVTTLGEPLGAPTNLVAEAISASTIRLTWQDHASGETGFEIERAPAGNGGPWTAIATTAADTTTYENTGLTPSTTYFYRVRATLDQERSAYSNVASATTEAALAPPDPPSGLQAQALSVSAIRLTWVDASTNETGFEIERAGAAAGPFELAGTVGANVVSWDDTGLAPSTRYWYRVRATNSAGDSAPSNVSDALTLTADSPPEAPSNLAAAAITPTSIRLTWQDNSTNEASFKIERAAASTGPFAAVASVGAGVTTLDDTGLLPSTRYWYRVRANNSAGDSAFSNLADATTPAQLVPPAAPSALTAEPASRTAIQLAWQDNSTNETGFKIEQAGRSTGPFSQVELTGPNVTSWTHDGLTAGAHYWYRVRATNEAGDSAYSNISDATTFTCTSGEKRCIAGLISHQEVCTSGVWVQQPCGSFSLCSQRACRTMCGMTATPLYPTICVAPNEDGVNNGEFYTTNSPTNLGPTYVHAGTVRTDSTPAERTPAQFLDWPCIWTLSGSSNRGMAQFQFTLNQWGGGPKTLRMSYRVAEGGLYGSSPACAQRDAQNAFGATVFHDEGPIINDWTTQQFLVLPAGEPAQFSYGANQWNTMTIFPSECGAGSFIDSLKVNWIRLEVLP